MSIPYLLWLPFCPNAIRTQWRDSGFVLRRISFFLHLHPPPALWGSSRFPIYYYELNEKPMCFRENNVFFRSTFVVSLFTFERGKKILRRKWTRNRRETTPRHCCLDGKRADHDIDYQSSVYAYSWRPNWCNSVSSSRTCPSVSGKRSSRRCARWNWPAPGRTCPKPRRPGKPRPVPKPSPEASRTIRPTPTPTRTRPTMATCRKRWWSKKRNGRKPRVPECTAKCPVVWSRVTRSVRGTLAVCQ